MYIASVATMGMTSRRMGQYVHRLSHTGVVMVARSNILSSLINRVVSINLATADCARSASPQGTIPQASLNPITPVGEGKLDVAMD